MNINKFTQKSMEAVQNCEKLAYEHGNQQLEQEHLLYSLLTLDDSLILKLITKMNISPEMFVNEAGQAVGRLTKVSGGGQLYVSSDLNKVLINAEDEAKSMGDEYVSVEHLFLSLIKQPDKTIKEIFRQYGWSLFTQRSRSDTRPVSASAPFPRRLPGLRSSPPVHGRNRLLL